MILFICFIDKKKGKWFPKGILIWSTRRPAPRLLFLTRSYIIKSNFWTTLKPSILWIFLSLGHQALQIKIPLGIHFLGPWEGGKRFNFFFVCWLDDCLIALKFSKNAQISKLFLFLIYNFSLQSYVLCVYLHDTHKT